MVWPLIRGQVGSVINGLFQLKFCLFMTYPILYLLCICILLLFLPTTTVLLYLSSFLDGYLIVILIICFYLLLPLGE